MPRVSVVLPNFNYARYLDERIAGLLAQTYRDFELVIVDDASTDESLEVIVAYERDPRVRVHRRTENSGRVYASWNEGLALCSGELVIFAGADDAAETELLEKLVACFDRRPNLGFAHCAFVTMDGAGRVLSTRIPLPQPAFFIVKSLASDYVAPPGLEWCRLLVTNFIWNASGVLMKTAAVREAGGFDPHMLIASDWLLYLQLARECEVAYLAEPLNAFRQLPKSVSKRLQGALLVDEMYACLERQKPFVDERSRPYFDAGLGLIAAALQNYLQLNTTSGNREEVERLLQLRATYGRGMT